MKAQTSIRIACRSHADTEEFALRLQADGYDVRRRWKAVIASTATPEEAERLARKLQLSADAGSEAAKRERRERLAAPLGYANTRA